MRVRWLVTGFLLAALVAFAPTVFGQGGAGIFLSPSCSSLPNPIAGSTWCMQTVAPNGVFYFDGATFTQPALSGPYAPTTLTSGAILTGNGTGPILATTSPSVLTLTTTGQNALVLTPWDTPTGSTGELRFLELSANGTEYVGFKGPDSVSTSVIFKLPNNPGTNGQCIVTDGASPVATLSYGACSGGGSGITSLNALVASIQTFTNDTNVIITSGGSAHVLGWTGTLSVARGGIGVGTLAANGILYGNGTGAVQATAAGSADQVLRVPGAGNPPAFGAVDVSKAAAITGLVRTGNLGSGSPDATMFLRGDQTWAVPAYTSTAPSNYGFNTSFETWGSGTSSAPTGWTTSSCSAVAKTTTAGQFKIGAAAVALTRTSGGCLVAQNVANTWGPIAYWQGQSVVLGGWVRCTVASRGAVEIFDGTTTTTSTTHSGGSSYEFLSIPATIGGGASTLEIRAKVSGGNTTCQFDGMILARGSSIAAWAPDAWQGRKATLWFNSGSVLLSNSGTNYFNFLPSTTETAVETPTPFKGVARNLTCRTTLVPTPGNYVFALRNNEAPKSLSVTVASGTQQANDATSEAEIAQFSRLSISSTPGSTPAVVGANCTIEYEEIP